MEHNCNEDKQIMDAAQNAGSSNTNYLNTVPPPSQSVCPHCGYCPHCGRSNGYRPYYPWAQYPWYVSRNIQATAEKPTGTWQNVQFN